MINNVVNVSNGKQPTGYQVTGSGSDVTNSGVAVKKAVTPSATSSPNIQGQEPASSEVHAAVTKLNDHNQNLRRNLSFSVDESTGHIIVRVYDSETNELIREIPSDETIRMATKIEGQNSEIFLRGQQA